MSENNIRIVKLRDMKLHPLVAENSESLASHEYVLKFINDIAPDSLNWLLNFHPIFVVQNTLNGYHVIFGFRTFNIASRLLPSSDEIKVTLLVNMQEENIRTGIYADLFLSPLTQSLRHPAETLSVIFRILPIIFAKKYIPNLCLSKSMFARSLGVTRNTLYYRRKAKCGGKK